MLLKQLVKGRAICYINWVKSEIRICLYYVQSGMFQPDIVVVVDIIDTHNIKSKLAKFFGKVKSDESCCTRIEN